MPCSPAVRWHVINVAFEGDHGRLRFLFKKRLLKTFPLFSSSFFDYANKPWILLRYTVNRVVLNWWRSNREITAHKIPLWIDRFQNCVVKLPVRDTTCYLAPFISNKEFSPRQLRTSSSNNTFKIEFSLIFSGTMYRVFQKYWLNLE